MPDEYVTQEIANCSVSDRAEKATLGAVLLDNAVWPQASVLRPCDFSLSANSTIFTRMRDLQIAEIPIDEITLAQALDERKELESVGGVEYLAALIDGLPDRLNITWHVGIVRRAAGKRQIANVAESIRDQALNGGAEIPELREQLLDLVRMAAEYDNANSATIRGYADIPDIMEIEVPPVEWIVDGMLPRESVTLWAGADGTAKTYLAMKMATEVARGGEFLNRRCSPCKVLYLDYENPSHEVKTRRVKMTGVSLSGLKTWGAWLEQQPPLIGDPILLKIAKEDRPLMIFDPFRYAHSAKENDSTEMMQVMRHLRSYATAGATVVILHHVAKAEGSEGRGSSVIRASVDIAHLQEMSATGLIMLRCVKNRFGQKVVITIRPDFEAGRFDAVDTPAAAERGDEATVRAIKDAIDANPGLNKTQIAKRVGGNRNRIFKLLGNHEEKLWRKQLGTRKAHCYYPLSGTEQYRAVPSTAGTGDTTGTTVSTPLGVVPVPVTSTGTVESERNQSARKEQIT